MDFWIGSSPRIRSLSAGYEANFSLLADPVSSSTSNQLASRRSGSRAQALYERLRQEILSGTLEPGDRLVEQDLAKSANVSRTPVREALQRLEADGLVTEGSGGLEVRAVSR